MLQNLSSVQTLQRKIRKSLRQRGLVQTGWRCVKKPMAVAYDALLNVVVPIRRRRLREDRRFDREFGTDTRRQRDTGWMARIESANWVHGNAYGPCPITTVMQSIYKLDIDHQKFSFIDFGSGKGRTILVAANFPFQQIIGVEYDPHLHEIAVANIARYRNPSQLCRDVRSTWMDATEYDLPSGPCVLFFYHPFERPIFEPICRRIERSLQANPRPVYVLYADPQCGDLFADSSRFRQLAHADKRDRHTCSIYASV